MVVTMPRLSVKNGLRLEMARKQETVSRCFAPLALPSIYAEMPSRAQLLSVRTSPREGKEKKRNQKQ